MSYISTTEFYMEVAKGNVAGHSMVNKFGRNEDIDTTSDPEDIWDGGGLWVPPTQARTHDIASTDTNDDGDPVGTGARTIRIEGLDENWSEVTEDITMDGTTNVPTVNTYERIYRMYLLTAGSGTVNAGDITATAQTDGTVTAQINTGKGQTLMAIYTVPSNKTGFLVNYYAYLLGRSGGNADVNLYVRPDASQDDWVELIKHSIGVTMAGGGANHLFNAPITITEKSDIILRVEEVSAINTGVDGGFELLLVDN